MKSRYVTLLPDDTVLSADFVESLKGLEHEDPALLTAQYALQYIAEVKTVHLSTKAVRHLSWPQKCSAQNSLHGASLSLLSTAFPSPLFSTIPLGDNKQQTHQFISDALQKYKVRESSTIISIKRSFPEGATPNLFSSLKRRVRFFLNQHVKCG